MTDKRVDPLDEQAYTFDEVRRKYEGEFNAAEVKDYWINGMTPLVGKGGAGTVYAEPSSHDRTRDANERRVDPDDGRVFTFDEFRRDKQSEFSMDEITAYWFDEMTLDLPDGSMILVSGLNKHTLADDLRRRFSEFGNIASIQTYYNSGTEESQGFAKIQYTSIDGAEMAASRGGGPDGCGHKFSVRRVFDKGRITKVFIGCMCKSTTQHQLEVAFSSCGEVTLARLFYDRETQAPNGQGVVEFVFPESVHKACAKFHLGELGGKTISCTPFVVDERRKRVPGPSCHVQNLSPETTHDRLRDHFGAAVGMVVNVYIVRDRDALDSRGFGMVELGHEALLRKAIEKLDGSRLDGNRIVVREAETRSPSQYSIFVGNMSFATTEERLRGFVSKIVGEVCGASIYIDRETGRSKGVARVDFKTVDAVRKALVICHDAELDGRALKVREFDYNGGKGSIGKPSGVSRAVPSPAQTPPVSGPSIFVTGIGPKTNNIGLRTFFAAAGEILDASVFVERNTGASRGIARVVFATTAAQQKAIRDYDESELDGSRIRVRAFTNGGLDSGDIGVRFEKGKGESRSKGSVSKGQKASGTVKGNAGVTFAKTANTKIMASEAQPLTESMALKFVDPNDGNLYTLEELEAKYKAGSRVPPRMPEPNSSAVNNIDVAATAPLPTPPSRKVEPEDGSAESFTEVKSKHAGELPSPPSRNVDPEVGRADGFAEVKLKYAGDLPTPPSRKVDPENGGAESFAEVKSKYTGELPTPQNRKVDPQDGRSHTFAEVKSKYAGEFAAADVKDYWDHDMEAEAPKSVKSEHGATRKPVASASVRKESAEPMKPDALEPGEMVPSALAAPEVQVSPSKRTMEPATMPDAPVPANVELTGEPASRAAVTAVASSTPVAAAGALETRIDLDDGLAYTYKQLEAKYLGEFSAAEVRDYWLFEMEAVPVKKSTSDAKEEEVPTQRSDSTPSVPMKNDAPRLANADGERATTGVKVAAAAEEVTSTVGKSDVPSVLAPAGTQSRKIDPEDGKAYTFAETKSKYEGEFDVIEVKEYWDHDMTAAPVADTSRTQRPDAKTSVPPVLAEKELSATETAEAQVLAKTGPGAMMKSESPMPAKIETAGPWKPPASVSATNGLREEVKLGAPEPAKTVPTASATLVAQEPEKKGSIVPQAPEGPGPNRVAPATPAKQGALPPDSTDPTSSTELEPSPSMKSPSAAAAVVTASAAPVAAVVPPETRIDLDDGQVYTYKQLEAKYLGEFSAAEVRDYWDNDMMSVEPVEQIPKLSKAVMPPHVEQNEKRQPPGQLVQEPTTVTTHAPELRKVDPDDGNSYTLEELRARYKGEFSASEVKAYWLNEMLDKPAAPEPAAEPPHSEKAESPALAKVQASSSLLVQGHQPPPTKLGSMPVNDFVAAVDAQWLRHLSQPNTRRGVREFLKALEDRQFSSVGQLLSAYGGRRKDGKCVLEDKFFSDVGVSKLGHKRIINKWIARNS